MTSLKIKDYTIEELLQFANVYDKRIENVEKKRSKGGHKSKNCEINAASKNRLYKFFS